MKNLILLLTVFFSLQSFNSFSQIKFAVYFKDKTNTTFSLSNPSQYLSQRAIDRRMKHNVSVDSSDLPVNKWYIDSLKNKGAIILNPSKWFNLVTISTDSATAVAIKQLPFVKNIIQCSGNPIALKPSPGKFEESVEQKNNSTSANDYGDAYSQIDLLQGLFLHNKNFKGQGMVIAVLDAGFLNTNNTNAFDSLFANNQILGTYDFVARKADVYAVGSGSHGTSVLSCMAANDPGNMIGTAPKASYYLLRSEDAPNENIIEEYHWASAAEYADSVGADIINSSLGYTQFDQAYQNHSYQDMNGITTVSSRAGDIAFSKGMLVIVAAGNEGSGTWHYISAPSDGIHALSIGAVDSLGSIAPFSSRGPSSDNRVKPNVCAVGWNALVVSPFGQYGFSNGTSFASPILAGMAAAFWGAFPQKTNEEISKAIQESADRFSFPDNEYGYGIPNFSVAYHTLTGIKNESIATPSFRIFPNPFNNEKLILESTQKLNSSILVNVFNSLGAQIISQKINNLSREELLLPDNLSAGLYLVNIVSEGHLQTIRLIKN